MDSYSEAATKRTVAYLPSMVSSWVGGLLSGTEFVTLISPTENGVYNDYSTYSAACFALASAQVAFSVAAG